MFSVALAMATNTAVEEAVAHVHKACGQRGGKRLLVSIAGGPGAGKSTFAATLAARLNSTNPESTVVVGMDGYHKTNLELQQLVSQQSLTPTAPSEGDTAVVPLRRYKGRMPSFHGQAFLEALIQLETATASLSLPVYDRELHEPRPCAVTVETHHKVVIVEGLFVSVSRHDLEGLPEAKLACGLLWERIASVFHCQIWIDCNMGLTRERLLRRKQLPCSTKEFEEQWKCVDVVNWDILQRGKLRLQRLPPHEQPLFLRASPEGTVPAHSSGQL